jgi:hypothetical protein
MVGPQLVITQKKSVVWYAAWSVFSLIILAICYGAGRYHSIEIQRELNERAENLQTDLDKYQRAYLQANEDLVMQTQTARVDNQSNQQLVETVKRLQETQMQLESELKFYRNIMAPELDQQGLTIAEFDVSKQTPDSKPRFKLVLTQVGRQEQFLKGQVELNLHGKINGEEKVYPFRELGTFQAKDFQFQFKYFQNIEGELSLPEGFIAEFITVQARTLGLRKNQTAEKQIDWSI